MREKREKAENITTREVVESISVLWWWQYNYNHKWEKQKIFIFVMNNVAKVNVDANWTRVFDNNSQRFYLLSQLTPIVKKMMVKTSDGIIIVLRWIIAIIYEEA